jgi:ATP-dependent Clp protease ATP-binding subunit ClpA
MQVQRQFKTEFINRLSEIVIFESHSWKTLKEIVKIEMRSIVTTVASKAISLSASDAAMDVILSQSYDPVSIAYFKIIL